MTMIPYEIFSTLMQESGVHNQWEYQELYDRKIAPVNLVPRDPAVVYSKRKTAWLTYKQVKKIVRKLKLKSQADWYNLFTTKDWCKPDGIPYHPDRSYKNKGWTTWKDFLGNGIVKHDYPSYNKLKRMVRKAKIKSHVEYEIWVKKTRKRLLTTGLPSNPDTLPLYKKQWKSWGDFLGTGIVQNQKKIWLSFKKARSVMRKTTINTKEQLVQAAKKGKLPKGVPADPYEVYSDKGWKGYRDFLRD